MSPRVRLLPTLIGAAGVLLVLRIGAVASTPEALSTPAESVGVAAASDHADTKETETKTGVPSQSSAGQAVPDSGVASSAGGAMQSQVYNGIAETKGEADVLQKLGERRSALDARERDLSLREQLLLAAEKQIAERMGELKALEQKLDVMMAKRNEQEEAQLVSLVKSYENIKPDDAARIFNRLERSILVDVASRMKPAKIGAVLAAMEPSRAQELTVLLAKRLKPTQLKPVSLPQPPPPALLPVAIAPQGEITTVEEANVTGPSAPGEIAPAASTSDKPTASPAEAPHG